MEILKDEKTLYEYVGITTPEQKTFYIFDYQGGSKIFRNLGKSKR
jgi:hypothetical protein